MANRLLVPIVLYISARIVVPLNGRSKPCYGVPISITNSLICVTQPNIICSGDVLSIRIYAVSADATTLL